MNSIIKTKIIREIIALNSINCVGCIQQFPSLNDHTCQNEWSFQVSFYLESALENLLLDKSTFFNHEIKRQITQENYINYFGPDDE